MKLKKWPVFMMAFFMGSAFYFVSADINMPPAFDSGQSGGMRCDSKDDKDCFYSQLIPDPDPDTHQAYNGIYTTTLQDTFGNSSYLMIESCLTQYGWFLGNMADCNTILDKNVFAYSNFLPFSWSGFNYIDLGYLNDLNSLTVHIHVGNVYTNTVGTAYGRRVYINNFKVPSSANVGDILNITWNVDNSGVGVTLLSGGPISCSLNNNNPADGNATCTITGSGTAQVELQAYGPGGEGPITVNEIKQINIAVPVLCGNGIIDSGEQCDGGNLNGQSCSSLGYSSGTLNCYAPGTASQCQFDTSACSNPPSPPPPPPPGGCLGNCAKFIWQNVPSTVVSGQIFSALIMMQNTGTTTWYASPAETAYKLGSKVGGNPWGGRLYLNNGETIPPGSSRTFSVDVTAPSPGTYDFQWQMLQEDVEWFGDITPNSPVNVTSPAPPPSSPPPPPSPTPGVPPVVSNVTISSQTVKADNSTQYIITVSSMDVAGAGNITDNSVIVNYLGENAGNHRGYLSWESTNIPSYAGYQDHRACGGSGGYAEVQPIYGASYIHLDSCAVSDSGNTRTTTFTVRFDPSFTTPATDNDIAGWTRNSSGLYPAWTNFQTDFNLFSLPPIISEVVMTEPNYCVSGPAVTVSWTYSDPAGSPQSAYQVQITNTGDFKKPVIDTGKVNSGSNSYFTGQGVLQFNTTYKAQARVWNGFDAVSDWATSKSSKTPSSAFPQTDFYWTANGIQNNPSPPLNKPVAFTDQTIFSGGGANTWNWNFGDSGTSTLQNPSHTYTEGTYYITLTATDGKNQFCPKTKGPLIIQKPIPKWREIAPR